MPSIVTHHLFAEEVLTKKIERKINKDVYYVFAQSFDNLFYYHFFTPWRGNKVRKIGKNAQRMEIQSYFKNMLTNIKKNKSPETLAYLYGSLTHYILDSTIHPYVIYHSGVITVNKKYRGGHEKMEVMIDAILYEEKTKIPLRKATLADTLLPKIKFTKELKDCITDTFQKTFVVSNMGTIYEKSFRTGHTLLKYFVTDHTGIKKKLYQLKDHFGSGKMYQYLSFYVTTLNPAVLNTEHHKWYYPTNNKICKTDSFYDLYANALQKAHKLFNCLDQYFEGKKSLQQVLNEIPDISYITGLDWHLDDPLKYFQY